METELPVHCSVKSHFYQDAAMELIWLLSNFPFRNINKHTHSPPPPAVSCALSQALSEKPLGFHGQRVNQLCHFCTCSPTLHTTWPLRSGSLNLYDTMLGVNPVFLIMAANNCLHYSQKAHNKQLRNSAYIKMIKKDLLN